MANRKATDALLADHRLIRKVLNEFRLDNPKFEKIAATLHRTVKGHAWFEDEIFLPVVRADPLFLKAFLDEISQEHSDIDRLLSLVRKTPAAKTVEREVYAIQLEAVLDTHFKKEEDALFPLAEKILTEEGLILLGEEMKNRQTEIRKFLED